MYLSKIPLDISVIYYTSNYLETENPYFVSNTKKQLVKAIDDLPLIIVSQKPFEVNDILASKKGDPPLNYVIGDIGRGHRNIYRQILEGCKLAKTKYVAMAEDDILYSYAHFHTYVPKDNKFAFDMQKLSIFTWGMPMFTFRTKRMVINQLIANREMLIEALEERFARIPVLKAKGKTDDWINSRWGDPGRYEDLLGVTVREREEFYCQTPSIVFSHPKALGYEFNQGKKKRLGDVRMTEIPEWGRAEDILKLYFEPEKKPEENNEKKLWDDLAKKNSMYYVNSDYGKGISEEQFTKSGYDDYVKYIFDDEMIPKKGSILEIGCGVGRMTIFISRIFDEVWASDISKEMIEKARVRFKDELHDLNNNMNFIETDGSTFPLADNSFDVVFSYLVFQHIKTREMVESNFREVYRVLKPGGIFKVRLRIDKVDTKKWWGGVNYSRKEAILMAYRYCFSIIKTEEVKNYGLWLWLQKGKDE